MSSNIHLKVASNQLRQDLSQIVDNFTLLDILSKEEQDMVLESKISSIKRKNEERMRRHQEIEEDKRLASGDGSTVPSPSSQMSQTPPPEQAVSSPMQQSTSPSLDSGSTSPASSTGRHGEDGRRGSGGDQWKPAWKDVREGERGHGGEGSKPRQEPSQKQPSSVKTRTETVEIDLHTTGTGLGFGVMNFPGVGVTVKTILPDGVAGRDGRLHSGDVLVQIDDINVENKSLDEVYSILKQCQGDVRLIVFREIREVPRGPSAQRREGQRRGPPKDTSKSKKEALVVTFQNDRMEREEKVKRKVVMRGGNKEDLTISVENDQSRPLGRGSGGGGRGRGRTVRISREEAKRKEFEEKRKENYDRVEAEIAALREALENEKAAGSVNPPSKSVYSFLDDPARYGAEPQQERSVRGNRHDRGRRNQRNHAGQDADIAASGVGRNKDQRGQGGQRESQTELETVTMTGKERQEYEEWKREREKIDQERIRRHQQAMAAQQQGNRWNQGRTGQEEDWDSEMKNREDEAGQGEMRIGHWDASEASNDQRVERRTLPSHFEHDDRVGDQRPQHNPRIGSGRFGHDGNQRGRGGGRGFHRGGRGHDQGRRGRGGHDQGTRPGRRPTPNMPGNLSQTDIRTVPGFDGNNPQRGSERSFQDSPIGQWEQSTGEDWDAEASVNPTVTDRASTASAKQLADDTKNLRIGPLPSPSAGSDCKSPLSPLSPFTPTGHTFLADWAAESEALGADGFALGGDLVYNNSNTGQGS